MVRLIACAGLAEYAQAIRLPEAFGAERTVPFIDGPSFRPSGFPPDFETVSFAEELRTMGRDASPSAEGVPNRAEDAQGRACIALNTPVLGTAAQLLSEKTGKTLTLTSESLEAWENEVRAALSRPDLASLTFVVPFWNEPTGKPDPLWLRRILVLMRAEHTVSSRLSWGIVGGVNPTQLTVAVAKSILQYEIALGYRAAPTGIFSNSEAKGLDLASSALSEEKNDGRIVRIERAHFTDGSARGATRTRWNLLLFSGHGRAYCGCDGYLCGARAFEAAPDAALRGCIRGMDCASAKYAQIDPREFDAPIFVLDSCAAASWSANIWHAGSASVAFLAMAGSPGAVIASDSVTMSHMGGTTDILWALAVSATLGESVARLNAVRKEAAAEFPYFLLGDPDVQAGTRRWPSWTDGCELAVKADDVYSGRPFEGEAPFIAVSLAHPISEEITPVARIPDCPDGVLGWRTFRSWERTDLWLGVAQHARTMPFEIVLQVKPSLPIGFLTNLERAYGRASSWGVELAASAGHVCDAAKTLLALNKIVEIGATGVEGGSAETCEALQERAYVLWLRALESCIEDALPVFTQRLDPSQFTGDGIQVAECASPLCPLRDVQGSADTVPSFSLDVPTQVLPGEVRIASLFIDNSAGETSWLCAGALLQESEAGSTLGPTRRFSVNVPPGQTSRVAIEFVWQERAAAFAAHRLRAIMVADALWFSICRSLAAPLGVRSCYVLR